MVSLSARFQWQVELHCDGRKEIEQRESSRGTAQKDLAVVHPSLQRADLGLLGFLVGSRQSRWSATEILR